MKNTRNNNASAGGGIGLTGLLQVAFIVLKLCKVIDWSWWWVLAPSWGSLLLLVVGLAIWLGIVLIKK